MSIPRRAARRAAPALILAALLPAAARAQSPAAPAIPDSVRVAANRVFAAWTATDGPGCAVEVARDGRVVHQNGYGMANLETGTPITPASVFHLASVSKQFTAAAVLLLARDGKLSLDDDVRKHLPELPDYGHRITIRHLLMHTSGLRDQWDLLAMARGRFEENRITEADVLEIVARQKALNYVPGAEYLYSNTGYTLAGTIVRRVSGKSLRDFAEERIFRPLGMTRTQFQDDYTRVIANRAAGYARRPTGRWHVSLPNYDTYGATSLFSDVGDLLRWQANFTKPVVGDSAMFAEMTALRPLANGDTSAYGLGLIAERHRGARVVSHGGADAGYRTWLGRFPDHDLDVVVLCNASTSNPAALARAVADVFLPPTLAAAALPMPPAVSVTPAQLQAAAGAYVNPITGGLSFVTLRGDSLIAGRTAGPALVPVGPNRFRVRGQPVEFEFASDGSMREHVLVWPARTPSSWRRVTVVRPTAAQLAAYAGTYHSEELGATYTVTARDSTLVLRTRWSDDVVLQPMYADAFGGPFVVHFTRRGGKVDGMTMSSGRVRRVPFTRAR
jgi:CubicO group peptidase (beta-lactamase class C family)